MTRVSRLPLQGVVIEIRPGAGVVQWCVPKPDTTEEETQPHREGARHRRKLWLFMGRWRNGRGFKGGGRRKEALIHTMCSSLGV